MKLPFFCQLKSKINADDWNLYSVEEDFQNFFPNPENCEWRISDVNSDYQVIIFKNYLKEL